MLSPHYYFQHLHTMAILCKCDYFVIKYQNIEKSPLLKICHYCADLHNFPGLSSNINKKRFFFREIGIETGHP